MNIDSADLEKQRLENAKERLLYEHRELEIQAAKARSSHIRAIHLAKQQELQHESLTALQKVEQCNITQKIAEIDHQLERLNRGAHLHKIEHQQTKDDNIPLELLWPLIITTQDQQDAISPEMFEELNRRHSSENTPEAAINKFTNGVIQSDLNDRPERYTDIISVISYCHETDDKRRSCIREAVVKNSENPNISKVVIAYHDIDPKIDTIAELFDNSTPPGKVTCINVDNPITFSGAIGMFKETILPEVPGACLILHRSSVVFPDNIHHVKKINLTNKVVCLSSGDKFEYWKTCACVVDSSVKLSQSQQSLKLGGYNAAERFNQDCFQNKNKIRNISLGDHVTVEELDKSGYTHDLLAEPTDKHKQWPYAKKITLSNYVVGDTCAWSACNYYYDDRFSGNPGKYFVRDVRELTYTYTNKVCVFYMTCMKEVKNGELFKCIDRFFSKPVSTRYCFDLHICIDTVHDTNSLTRDIKNVLTACGGSMVSEVFIHNANLTEEQNIFTYDLKKYAEMPQQPLGASNGVNQTFYSGLEKMCSHNRESNNYMLMLEADCIPIDDHWYDTVYNYCETNPSFAIAGSKHRGLADGHRVSYYADHINGVAIYKNTPELEKILNGGQEYIKKWINIDGNTKIMNFDVGNYMYAESSKLTDHLIEVPFISNYSSAENTRLSVNEVLERHPDTSILHKKLG